MWKTILKKVLIYCATKLYDYVDKNDDGKIDMEELKKVRTTLNKTIRKLRKKYY